VTDAKIVSVRMTFLVQPWESLTDCILSTTESWGTRHHPFMSAFQCH